jgi:hypothetical protein
MAMKVVRSFSLFSGALLFGILFLSQVAHAQQNNSHSTLANTSAYSYFNDKLPFVDWIGNDKRGHDTTLFYYDERFTLAGESGYLDSISFLIDAISSDSVVIGVLEDTVIETAIGSAHVALSNRSLVDNLFISASRIHGPTWITLRIPHVLVAKEFHLAIAPLISGDGALLNTFSWRADEEPARARTAENTRSSWGAVDSNLNILAQGFLDGTVNPPGRSSPIYTNFYAIAYVEPGPLAVSMSAPANFELTLYPNPSTSVLNISAITNTRNATLQIVDLLGRTVLDLTNSLRDAIPTRISTTNLLAGVYHVMLRANGTTQLRSFTVLH